MHIGFDIDGVLTDHVTVLQALVKTKFNIDFIWDRWEIDELEIPNMVKKYLHYKMCETDFICTLPITEEAYQCIQALLKLKCQIRFITNRDIKWGKVTYSQITERLHQWFPVIFTDDKTKVITKEQIFVEDKLENAQRLHDETSVQSFLLDRPYNQGDYPDHLRIKSLSEVVQYVENQLRRVA